MSSKMPSQECCFDCQFIQQSTTAEEPLKHSYGHIIVESHPHIVNGECNSEMSFRLNEYKKGNGFPRPDLTTGASEHFDSGIGLGSKPGSPTDEEVSRWEQQKMQTPTSTKDVCPKSNEQANGKPKVKPPVKPKNKSRPLLSSGAPKSSRHDKPGTDTPGRNLDHEEPPIQAGLTFDELVQKDIKNFMSRIKSGWTFSNPRFVGQEIGAEGGHLEIKSGNGNYSVHLILPEGAVNQAQPIYMAVNWNTRGISPRVKLGPPGRKFNKCVYLKIPIYSDKDKDLAVIRREDENSEWMTNPGTAKCLHLGDDAMIETSSFSDYELKPQGQFCFRWLHVFVQQGTDGDGVSVRVYLTKDQDNEALTKREKGLNGVMRRKTNIPLDNQPLRLELRCDRGLKTLDFTNYRVSVSVHGTKIMIGT
ncbi:uncharacterized protein LOC135466229 [Liolophura sinensis]|uniref:uncharacterized protein LOC135466229 n=1 Tax=Liolophura sinensis TaxID=3198878 RepID=UPI0031588C06